MDESAAIAIADQVAVPTSTAGSSASAPAGSTATLLKSSYEEDWREGRFPADVTEVEFRGFIENLELSPFWTVGYLLYLHDDVTIGTVTIDEGSGATEWDVQERPSS